MLSLPAQTSFVTSSCIRLRWQREILDDLRSQEVKTDKQIKAATTKHTENLAGRAICESCRTTRAHSRRADDVRYVAQRAPGVECSAMVGHFLQGEFGMDINDFILRDAKRFQKIAEVPCKILRVLVRSNGCALHGHFQVVNESKSSSTAGLDDCTPHRSKPV